MNDLESVIVLLNKNGIDYHITELYDTVTSERCGHAVWLKVGHFEFNRDGMIENVVSY